MRNFT